MLNWVKNTVKYTANNFMFVRAATQDTHLKALDAFAMDTCMMTGMLGMMTLNPLNKDMMIDDEFTTLWKSGVTMILGMGLAMLSYHAIKDAAKLLTQSPDHDDRGNDLRERLTATPPLV